MSTSRFWASCVFLLLLLGFATGAMGSVEYTYNGVFAFGSFPSESATFDLVVPDFITSSETITSWNTCSFTPALQPPGSCSSIDISINALNLGGQLYDSITVNSVAGGLGPVFFLASDLSTTGTYSGNAVFLSTPSGQLTVASTAPEPSSLLLLGMGFAAAAGRLRRRLA